MKLHLIRNYKAVAALVTLTLILTFTTGAAFTLYKPQMVYEVCMDGEPLGYVQSMDEYKKIVEAVYKRAEAEWNCDLVMNQELSASRKLLWQPRFSPELVTARVELNADYITSGWALRVNGQDVVIVATEAVAESLLEAVQEQYLPEAANRTLLEIQVLDDVKIARRAVEPSEVVDSDTAFNILLQGQKESSSYIVQRGDTLSAIASRSNVQVSKLREVNPNLQGDIIQVGQVLNLETNTSQLRIHTVEELRVTETVPFTTRYQSNSDLSVRSDKVIQAGKNGSRDVVYKVELINGQEVKRSQIAVDVTLQPTDKVIMPGIGNWPLTPTGQFRFPINTGRISDRFGTVRRGGRNHTGLDIAAPRGTPIYAAADGVVTTRSYGSSYGYYVVIQHDNNYSTLYAHASRFANISVGSRVVRGQVIAYVGNTGYSTGPHLHWEVRQGGTHVNPLGFFR